MDEPGKHSKLPFAFWFAETFLPHNEQEEVPEALSNSCSYAYLAPLGQQRFSLVWRYEAVYHDVLHQTTLFCSRCRIRRLNNFLIRS